MQINPILAPAAILIFWTLLVLVWMVLTRWPAFAKAGVNLSNTPRGVRYVDVEKQMPDRVNWVAHNYTHLVEQPTLFYAVVAILAISGDTHPFNLGLAWGYTGLRILHSLWQVFVNTIPVRVVLFTLATLCLGALSLHAVMRTVHW